MTRARAAEYAALPYPGRRPTGPFIQHETDVLTVDGDGATWWVEDKGGREPVDRWLRRRGAVAMAERVPLLCYGSNACPSKLVDLRVRCGLVGPAVMTPCTVKGLAAAWCSGRRAVDGSVPATLIPHAGTESHFIWWVSREQWPALDRCEGRAGSPWDRYAVVVLPARAVSDGFGRPMTGVRAYVGRTAERLAVLDEAGLPLLVRDVPQHEAHAAALRRRR